MTRHGLPAASTPSRDVVDDDAARPDHRVGADADARAYDHPGREPYVVAEHNRSRGLPAGSSGLVVVDGVQCRNRAVRVDRSTRYRRYVIDAEQSSTRSRHSLITQPTSRWLSAGTVDHVHGAFSPNRCRSTPGAAAIVGFARHLPERVEHRRSRRMNAASPAPSNRTPSSAKTTPAKGNWATRNHHGVRLRPAPTGRR